MAACPSCETENAITFAREVLELAEAKGALGYVQRAHEVLEVIGADRP